MGWAIGYDDKNERDIGYVVPAICDHPGCNEKIDRGLSYACGSEPYGGEDGCGLFFCDEHLGHAEGKQGLFCERCRDDEEPFTPKEDIEEWKNHKRNHPSWAEWRKQNPQNAEAQDTEYKFN